MTITPAALPAMLHTLTITRRVPEAHDCDVPGCKEWVHWYVVTEYTDRPDRQRTFLCLQHGWAFMNALGGPFR